MSPLTPEVLWAQRSNATEPEKNIIYLTINVADVKPDTLKFEIQPNTVSFSGTNSKGQEYAIELPLFAEIDPAESRKHISSRGVEAVLRKKEAKEEFWPRLLSDSKKVHWLKTDFDKWVDEDEQEEEEPNPMANAYGGPDDPLSNFDFSQFGGAGGATGGGDSDDDEDMPELEEADAEKTEETKKEEAK